MDDSDCAETFDVITHHELDTYASIRNDIAKNISENAAVTDGKHF